MKLGKEQQMGQRRNRKGNKKYLETNEQPKVTIIETGKRRTNEAQSQQKEGHNKDQRINK